MSEIRIELGGTRTKVIVEGKDVSALISGYTLTQKAGGVPEFTLVLPVTDACVVGDAEVFDAQVRIGDEKTAPEEQALERSTVVLPPSRSDKHYELVRHIFELCADHNLTVRDLESVLDQVRAIAGYTPIRWRAQRKQEGKTQLSKLADIREVVGANLTNNFLKAGWVLLEFYFNGQDVIYVIGSFE